MLKKWHYCAMNENCCSVDWGRTIPGTEHLPSSLAPTAEHLAAKVSPPREFAIQEQKYANARGLARGRAWAQLELTAALEHVAKNISLLASRTPVRLEFFLQFSFANIVLVFLLHYTCRILRSINS